MQFKIDTLSVMLMFARKIRYDENIAYLVKDLSRSFPYDTNYDLAEGDTLMLRFLSR